MEDEEGSILSDKGISAAVIKRLPRYYRYLDELLEKDVVRISSKELSQKMNVTASQIRQDLNHFGGFGQQGYGYNVDLTGRRGLLLSVRAILGRRLQTLRTLAAAVSLSVESLILTRKRSGGR